MTVDKPPLALWVQALSVRAFGFHSLAHARAAGADGRRRRSGWPTTSCGAGSAASAGFVGGLALALTPITVAISRHNNPDALLVLCCVAALWCARARRWRTAARAGSCCAGVVRRASGFETKMGAALLVVPALAAAYLWVAPRGRLAALRQLLAGGAAMVVVGGAWPLLMCADAGRRPPVDLGHERQQHLVADLRLQRPRPARRPGRRAGRRRRARRRRRRRRAVRRRRRRRCGCSTPRSAARPAGCSASPLVARPRPAVATRLRRARRRGRAG